MLMLSRKTTECVQIGDRVILTVLEVRGNRVRIGITAPKEITVRRGEPPRTILPVEEVHA